MRDQIRGRLGAILWSCEIQVYSWHLLIPPDISESSIKNVWTNNFVWRENGAKQAPLVTCWLWLQEHRSLPNTVHHARSSSSTTSPARNRRRCVHHAEGFATLVLSDRIAHQRALGTDSGGSSAFVFWDCSLLLSIMNSLSFSSSFDSRLSSPNSLAQSSPSSYVTVPPSPASAFNRPSPISSRISMNQEEDGGYMHLNLICKS